MSVGRVEDLMRAPSLRERVYWLVRRVSLAIGDWCAVRGEALRYERAEAAALPDGTRVRLVCLCKGSDHSGIWVTNWSPRRTGCKDDPYDYQLTREGDGAHDYAHGNVLEVVR